MHVHLEENDENLHKYTLALRCAAKYREQLTELKRILINNLNVTYIYCYVIRVRPCINCA